MSSFLERLATAHSTAPLVHLCRHRDHNMAHRAILGHLRHCCTGRRRGWTDNAPPSLIGGGEALRRAHLERAVILGPIAVGVASVAARRGARDHSPALALTHAGQTLRSLPPRRASGAHAGAGRPVDCGRGPGRAALDSSRSGSARRGDTQRAVAIAAASERIAIRVPGPGFCEASVAAWWPAACPSFARPPPAAHARVPQAARTAARAVTDADVRPRGGEVGFRYNPKS